jgi:hypothetical protein
MTATSERIGKRQSNIQIQIVLLATMLAEVKPMMNRLGLLN